MYKSQGYNGFRVFYFRILYQSIGIDHIRLGPVALEVQRIVKRRYEAWRLFIDEECASSQHTNSHNNQNNYQTCVGTTPGVSLSVVLCKGYRCQGSFKLHFH